MRFAGKGEAGSNWPGFPAASICGDAERLRAARCASTSLPGRTSVPANLSIGATDHGIRSLSQSCEVPAALRLARQCSVWVVRRHLRSVGGPRLAKDDRRSRRFADGRSSRLEGRRAVDRGVPEHGALAHLRRLVSVHRRRERPTGSLASFAGVGFERFGKRTNDGLAIGGNVRRLDGKVAAGR